MRQRTEVAARADGAAKRDERNDTAVEHGLHGVDEQQPHTGMSEEKGIEADHQRASHDFCRVIVREIGAVRVFAHTDRVAQQKVPL